MHQPSLRNCTPNDAHWAVPLIYASGPDAFDYVFQTKNQKAQEFLSFAFKRKGGEFSFDNHYALTLEGRPIGIGAIFDGKKALGFPLTDAQNIMRYYKLQSPQVLVKGLRTEKIIQPPKTFEHSLVHLAIDPQLRGQGLGTTLVALLMQQLPLGAMGEKFVLDVSLENPRAKKLYKTLGFKVSKTIQSTLKNQYGHVPSHHRMELAG
ncbi:GNAT family N-acetyltransferase [Sediminicola luteus]|nr:N-acetyltransferase [Sediminicola luteus]